MLKRLFQNTAQSIEEYDPKKSLVVLDEHGNKEDPFLSEAINRTWQSGKPVIANKISSKTTFKSSDY